MSVLTGTATGPTNATFQQACAVANQLWSSLVSVFDVSDNDGNTLVLKKTVKLPMWLAPQSLVGWPLLMGLTVGAVWKICQVYLLLLLR